MPFSFGKLTRLLILCVVSGIVFAVCAEPAQSQGSVTVEAIQYAKVRSGPGVQYDEIATIYSGTQYPMIGRSAQFPWYLIQLPDAQGWVFKDIVKVTGDYHTIPFSSVIITPGPTNTSTEPPASTSTPLVSLTPSPTLDHVVTETPTLTGVTAEAIDETNVRFGPGTDFQRIGTIYKGQAYSVLRRHALYPTWIEIAVPGMGGGRGWVNRGTVNITGDLSTVDVTSDRDFGYPTLTATPVMVVQGIPPWVATPNSGDARLEQVSEQIYNYLLDHKFEPGTDMQGSAFIMDLQTGAAYSLNPGLAYSGMSLIKIPILVTLYRKLNTPPTKLEVGWLGEMMVCSDNLASNAILRFIGDGDPFAGAAQVTQTMQGLGLTDTFLLTPFDKDPNITPEPVQTMKTNVDQTSTAPDLYNQTSPASLGWLLSGIYRCASDGSGPLVDTYPGQYTENECRQMIRALSADKIGALIEAGVPTGTQVGHKHGWIDDTHGDAALVFTPGGDYVLTIELHGKTWLNYDDSFPVVSEVSRMVYNNFNPDKPLDKIHPEPVPATCTIDPSLTSDLQNADLPPLH